MKLHKQFQYIYKKGKNQHSSSVVLFFLPNQSIRKVGFTATKKIGNAVKRNRAKRRLRALFLKHSANLKNGTYIFVAKQSIIEIPHANLEKDFEKVIFRSHAFKENIE
ncbi:MAG: ribonuclease P protein component [Helicobacteraceae bacterium]|nr:ribonuclease P protein component [Candidatus Sulfurimonas ponti]MBL6974085.1 ribonuclease P protein component [Sulfurimonas sp.]